MGLRVKSHILEKIYNICPRRESNHNSLVIQSVGQLIHGPVYPNSTGGIIPKMKSWDGMWCAHRRDDNGLKVSA
jgi:hypothetical protein